jgi:FkbM family methyltransferase
VRVDNICNHSFLGDYISEDSTILDCGVNHGDFSLSVSKKWHCKIYGLEPDPRLFTVLPKIEECTFYKFALADRCGNMKLNLGNSLCSSLYYKEHEESEKVNVETITLQAFCTLNNIDKIDLLKLDIEGAELSVLSNIEDEWVVANVIQITVEFHEFLDQSIVFQIRGIISKLKKLGFYYFPFSRTFGDILFVNSRFIKLSPIDLFRIIAVKYKRGISRILFRMRSLNPN